MKKNIVSATDNLLLTVNAKTAHGLIRGSKRFEVLGIIDEKYKNTDAGDVLDASYRNIPVSK